MRVPITIFCIVLLTIPTASGYNYLLQYQTLDGEEHVMDEYEGEYLLFEIMTTWCESCKAQMAELDTVYDNVVGKMYLMSIGVDQKTDTLEKLENYKEKYNASWTFALDYKNVFKNTFNVDNYPTIIFLGPEGKLLKKWTAFVAAVDLLDEIDNHLDIEYEVENNQIDNLSEQLEHSLLIPVGIFTGVVVVIYFVLRIFEKVAPKNIPA